jgi:hypothetical protein
LNAGRLKRTATVGASGFGMDPHEKLRLEWVNPYGAPTTLATGLADEHGDFAGLTFKVPDNWPDGDQTVKVTGLGSGRAAIAHIAVEASTPGALPSTYFGKPLTPVNFQGGGFQPHEQVDVYFDSFSSAPLSHFEADGSGLVKVNGILVPPASPGDHAFLLVGQRSSAPVRVPFSVLAFTPWLTLTDYTPQPEHSVGVVAHDFAPGEPVAVFLNAPIGRPVAEGRASARGVAQLNPAFEVPYNVRGKLIVVAVGGVSQTAVSATLTVRPYTPLFELSTYAGPPGSLVTAKGSGFGHSERLLLRLGGSTQDPATTTPPIALQSDGAGAFKMVTPFRIPDRAAAGKLVISIVGDRSQIPATTTFAVLAITPWISPIPAAGGPGKTVALDGGGFEPGEPIVVKLGALGANPTTTVVADRQGGIRNAGSLPIPASASGRVALEATGLRSGGKASAVYTVISGKP